MNHEKKSKYFKIPRSSWNKKNKYVKIRDEIEKLLFSYAIKEKDLWAVSLAAGRFASMNLDKIDGTDKTIEFFKNCIDTQKKNEN